MNKKVKAEAIGQLLASILRPVLVEDDSPFVHTLVPYEVVAEDDEGIYTDGVLPWMTIHKLPPDR